MNQVLLLAVNARFSQTNLAVRYLKEALQTQKIGANILEVSINDSVRAITAGIAQKDWQVLACSCYIWNIEIMLAVASNIKKIFPERTILLGGPEVSYNAQEILERYPFIDAVFCGEGEEHIGAAVQYLFGKIQIPPLGLSVRGIVPQFATVSDLSTVPYPYVEGIEDIKNKIIYYESSRGCPYHCSYCLSGGNGSVRFLPIVRVFSELQHLSDNGARLVKFVDRTFNCDRQRAREIWNFVSQLQSETCWHFEISGDLLQEEDIALLSSMPKGRIQLEIGVQSTNPDTLAQIHRQSNLDQLKVNVTRLLALDNIHVHLDLIAGLPGESFESFKHSFNEVYALKPSMLQLGFLKRLKGAEIAEEKGMVFDEKPPFEILFNDHISYFELNILHGVEEMLDRYYNSGGFTKTLRLAEHFFETPFELYSALADLVKEMKGGIGEDALYVMLYHLLENTDANAAVSNLLKLDYLRKSKRSKLPDFMPQTPKDTARKILDAASETLNMSVKDLNRCAGAAYFEYDIEQYLTNGELAENPSYVLFDYRFKPARLHFFSFV